MYFLESKSKLQWIQSHLQSFQQCALHRVLLAVELWQDSCEEDVIQRCQAFLQQSLEINEVTRAVAKKNYNSDYGQDNDDEGDSCHDNIGGVLLVNNNAMMMMLMMIRAVIKISSWRANDTSRWEIQ